MILHEDSCIKVCMNPFTVLSMLYTMMILKLNSTAGDDDDDDEDGANE